MPVHCRTHTQSCYMQFSHGDSLHLQLWDKTGADTRRTYRLHTHTSCRTAGFIAEVLSTKPPDTHYRLFKIGIAWSLFQATQGVMLGYTLQREPVHCKAHIQAGIQKCQFAWLINWTKKISESCPPAASKILFYIIIHSITYAWQIQQ